jgi:hypothetical protein
MISLLLRSKGAKTPADACQFAALSDTGHAAADGDTAKAGAALKLFEQRRGKHCLRKERRSFKTN